jgi:FKBP-type peptidyl-prolyl cis-trans isomerase FklB
MKKLTFVAAMAIAAAAFTGCGNSTPKADLKSDVDSMSYGMGLAQSQGLKDFLVQRMNIDTTYMDEFIKGLNDGANAGDDKKKAAYYAGIQIGQQISNQMIVGINHEVFGNDSTKTISMKNFMAGFVAGTTGKNAKMTVEQAQTVAETKMREIKTKNMEKEYGPNKLAGEKFLAGNKKQPDVKTLPSGVQYKVLKEGTGAMPKDTSRVKVHYEGRTIDGNVFDSSYKNGTPITLRANQVIKGFTDALVHMPEGSEWEIYIPQELAYGEKEQGQIKPFSALIFDVELVEIDGHTTTPATTTPAAPAAAKKKPAAAKKKKRK